MQEKVEKLFKSYLVSHLDKCPGHLIAAYSGGPDSSVLLYMLHKFQKNFSYTFSGAYINHNIRNADEMKLEQLAVTDWADKLGVELHLKVYPPGFIEYYSRKSGLGIEGAARNCRYHFFRKLLNSRQPCTLALGHNRNDQLETLLMRIFQGSGSGGLKGIPGDDPDRLRPLLDVSREDILAYAEHQGIPYCHDSTNTSGDYLRNRIRKDLIPVLYDIFPQPDKALFQLTREIHKMGSALTETARWEKQGESWCLRTDKFDSLPLSVKKNLVLEKMDELNRGILPRDTRIPGRFFKPLEKKLPEKDGGGRILLKGYNIVLEKRSGWYILGRENTVLPGGFFHLLTEDNPLVTENFTLSYGDGRSSPGSCTFQFPLSGTLCVRENFSSGYSVCDGSLAVVKLDNEGKMLYSRYGNEKNPENTHPRKEDCVIIKLEVNYAPGRQ